jgi:hypothetical protein
MTDTQKKEVFKNLISTVRDLITDKSFENETITGEIFYDKYLSKFSSFSSPILYALLTRKKDKIIEIFNEVYDPNKVLIKGITFNTGIDSNARAIKVVDLIFSELEDNDIIEPNPKPYWIDYKEKYLNKSGGKRKNIKTKKRKTRKYKRMSKRNRKY